MFIEDVCGMDSSFLLFEGDALGRRDDLPCTLQRSQHDIWRDHDWKPTK